ncbi:MAG: exosortase/archaeosortase family protein, partial [Akkermansiaceae bacterium]|nr:exosortase/archaeosortase family protein [Akkermansiaceae bacterium]
AFGYFVPPAVIVLLWVTRNRFAGLEGRHHWVGLAILLFGFFIYFSGYKANQKYVGYAAGQILAAGGVVWLFGLDYFRRGFWLWVLFGLTWPWIFLIEPVSVPLRMIMTKMTFAVLTLIGEETVREGTTILSAPTEELATGERFSLKVAAACSGLRSLFALAMVSLLYGYLSLEKSWQRFLLFVTAIPLAVLGNFVRMMLLYAGTLWFGSEFAIGKGEDDPSAYHIGAGLVVFVVALAGMMVIVQILKHGVQTLRPKRTAVRHVQGGAEVSP